MQLSKGTKFAKCCLHRRIHITLTSPHTILDRQVALYNSRSFAHDKVNASGYKNAFSAYAS